MSLSIDDNRKAVKYSKKELLLRVFWGVGKVVFLFSPRPCFGFRRIWLRLFGATIGKEVNIYPSAKIYFPWNLVIGDYSAISEWALVYNLGKVTIGKRSTISHRAHICAGTHDYTDPALPLIKPPIEIGDEVWVCADSFIGPGVNVRSGSVIGGASVVTKDVESWTVVAGNPAKYIKKRVIDEK